MEAKILEFLRARVTGGCGWPPWLLRTKFEFSGIELHTLNR